MIKLASKLAAIPASVTVAISSKAQELQRQGKDIISLGAGEPDLDTPENIRNAAIQAIHAGKTRYAAPAGIIELRQAISEKLKRDNNLTYSVDEIVVGCGAKQSFHNTLLATLESGDEVIVPAPYWVSYVDITAMVGGTPVVVACTDENNYKLQPEELERAITDKTRWLILCSPSNPTGAVYTDEDLAALAEVLRRHPHVYVIGDHIYEHLLYDGVVSRTINQVAPDLHSRTVIINGMSKAYAMTGWRLGYAAGPKELMKAIVTIQSQSTTSTSTISQWAGVEALNGDQSYLKTNQEIFKARRDLVVDALNTILGITCKRPDGAFYVYPSCAGVIGKQTPSGTLIKNDEDFAAYLLEAGVSVVHGAAFGLSPNFRISYAASTDSLKEACARIARACGALIDPKA